MKRFLIPVLILVLMALFGARLLHRRTTASSNNSQLENVVINNGARVPVLVELFTSEGCSSCPPADKVLTSLMEKQPIAGAQIITLSEHVDYWNRLGWTDPYSAADFSKRQYDYADVFGGDSVYTPEMVVDGRSQFVGSDADAANEAIEKAIKAQKALVEITRFQTATGAQPQDISLQVHVGNLSVVKSRNAEILLAVTENKLSSNVTDGENAGQRLLHSSVVRSITPLGNVSDTDGQDFNATTLVRLSDKWKPENLNIVVFLQDKTNRQILGAGIIALNK
ncbi:MAG TPA: DUF1223 domain-containing protein [Blastocatellia bacterium]|nr:DUF1223 domain-containing protein [Blastocatellia bacterium]